VRVVENRLLRIFGPKRDDVIECSRKCIERIFQTCILENKNINDKVKENYWATHAARMEEKRRVRIIWWKSQKKRGH
jgi:hypothetical protein